MFTIKFESDLITVTKSVISVTIYRYNPFAAQVTLHGPTDHNEDYCLYVGDPAQIPVEVGVSLNRVYGRVYIVNDRGTTVDRFTPSRISSIENRIDKGEHPVLAADGREINDKWDGTPRPVGI